MANKKGAGRPKGQGYWKGEETKLIRVPISLKSITMEFMKLAWAIRKNGDLNKFMDLLRLNIVDNNNNGD